MKKTRRENPDTLLEDLHKYRAKLSKKFAKMTNREITEYYNSGPSNEEFLARIREERSEGRKPARRKKQHA